ncbi:hypothetical protein EV421DRAFT_2013835 [Armillaria borealis]|uniref:F-box domain-containing protein n=1 Tax=Armillaria borealis TaxID=47425 RepID=A0AA39KBF6_9AGAR|nr:hypothetical protein EV421DRAFT_2013835 [Armillaria borealis]
MPSVSKMNQVPDELLALIFATGLRDLPSDAHQPLLALICSVCRHWRDVAIGASELWTTIHVPLEGHLPVIQTFLERSKGRLIDLDITVLDSAILAHKVAEITAPHISRARTLIMTLPDLNIYNVFSKAYRTVSATSLSSLSIHLTDALWSPQHGHSTLFASTNSLCYIDTEGYFLRDIPSRASLTALKLNKYCPTHVDLQNLFDASPCLETLVLHQFDMYEPLDLANEGDDGAPITIIAPTTLKFLAVSVFFAHSNDTDGCGCVLDKLCIPNLEYLEVVGSTMDLNVHFRELAKLQTLRIQRCTITSADQFFLSAKELRRLELVDMPSEDLRHITGISTEDPSSPSFPHLSSVFFSTKREYMESPHQLLQLAEHCVATGCPYFALEVEQGRSEEFLSAIKSRIQDGRVCIRDHPVSDEGETEIEEEEMDEEIEWEPEWEIEYDDERDEEEDDMR